jgi:hypothetical protein
VTLPGCGCHGGASRPTSRSRWMPCQPRRL